MDKQQKNKLTPKTEIKKEKKIYFKKKNDNKINYIF